MIRTEYFIYLACPLGLLCSQQYVLYVLGAICSFFSSLLEKVENLVWGQEIKEGI